MVTYLTPGIYRRPQPVATPAVLQVRTDIAGFAGYTERGPFPPYAPTTDSSDPYRPPRLSSWKEFQTIYGGFIEYGYLAYAVRAFFETGGATCYVARVAAMDAVDPLQRPRAAAIALPDGSQPPAQVAQVQVEVPAGQTDVTMSTTAGIFENDLLVIYDDKPDPGSLPPASAEFVMVERVIDATAVRFARKLRTKHTVGEAVKKYASGLLISATNEGNWGNRIQLEIIPLQPGPLITEFALRVTLQPNPYDTKGAVQEEYFKHVTLQAIIPASVSPPTSIGELNSDFIQVQMNVNAPAQLKLTVDSGLLAGGPVYLQGGRDGLSQVTTKNFTGGWTDDAPDMQGLRLLEKADDVGILCAPDAVFVPPMIQPPKLVQVSDPCAAPPAPPPPDAVADDRTAIPPAADPLTFTLPIYRRMIEQCERLRYRVAVLDSQDDLSLQEIVNWRGNFRTRFAALYYPWLKVDDPLELTGLSRRVPPSGHVAGAYAATDIQFGVQKPPANIELGYVLDVGRDLLTLDQDNLNPYSVNAIRTFPGRGIRVWGARTLAAVGDPDWMFIHVRRLMSMIEKSVEISMQWAVFQPNTDTLRRSLVHSLTVFLEGIWRTGGLKGATPAQSFFVKCDGKNNPQSMIDAGQIVCQVGVAVAVPMEFLVFEIRQSATNTQLAEG
jgi:phage tail sheath protein FI